LTRHQNKRCGSVSGTVCGQFRRSPSGMPRDAFPIQGCGPGPFARPAPGAGVLSVWRLPRIVLPAQGK
jgi:hypothetical protein